MIVPPSTYLMMNKNFYQYTSLPCIELRPNYYCPNNDLIDGLRQPDCVFRLLQLSSTYVTCQQTPVRTTTNLIEQIDESHYIAILPNQTKIQTTCKRSDFTTLRGNYLIELPTGCRFETDENKFINEKIVSHGQPMLLPEITVPHSPPTENVSEIIIKDIHLDKIHELQKQQHNLGPIHTVHTENSSTTHWIIPIYITITIVGAYYSFQFIRNKRRPNPPGPTDEQPPTNTTAFFSP